MDEQANMTAQVRQTQVDHDVLIRLDTKMDNILISVKEINIKFDQQDGRVTQLEKAKTEFDTAVGITGIKAMEKRLDIIEGKWVLVTGIATTLSSIILFIIANFPKIMEAISSFNK